MRVLGIDPGVATIGFGVVDFQRGGHRLVRYGVITTPPVCPCPAACSRSRRTWGSF